MQSVAVIGSGIAGLACAYMLRNKVQLTVFEQNDYIGGHTNTIRVHERDKLIPIDTGFMVHNEVTYPYLTQLFKELGVKSKPTDMSFSVHNRRMHLEWSGTGFNRLFGQRRNLINIRFWKMLLELDRFNKTAMGAMNDPAIEQFTLNDFVAKEKFSQDMLNFYLLPMMSALWSAPPETMLNFPISVLLRFMYSHGLLSMYGKHQWLTVCGGAKSYVDAMIATFREKIYLNATVVKVQNTESNKVSVTLADGEQLEFDQCILACHADQACQILDQSFVTEREILENFQYQSNIILVHTDTGVMPTNKRNWASWNYLIDDQNISPTTTHYWMNSLQQVSEQCDYFVSLNAESFVDSSKILRRIEYHHPIFTVAAMNAQKKLKELNKTKNRNVFLCGSYFSHGFHEDALASSVDVVNLLQGVVHEEPELLFV